MRIGKNSLPAGGVPLHSSRGLHEFHRLYGWRPDQHILFSFFFRFLLVTFVEKNPPARSADALVLIWDIERTLAWACRERPHN